MSHWRSGRYAGPPATPNAAKAFLAFMMEKPQYDLLLAGSAGYISQSVKGFANHPVWEKDPRIRVFRDVAERGKAVSWPAPVTQAAASVFADFVVIDMFEALALGRAAGLDLAKLREVLLGGAASSWMLQNLGPLILAKDASAGFWIDLKLKDLRLAGELAFELGVPLPGTALATRLASTSKLGHTGKARTATRRCFGSMIG